MSLMGHGEREERGTRARERREARAPEWPGGPTALSRCRWENDPRSALYRGPPCVAAGANATCLADYACVRARAAAGGAVATIYYVYLEYFTPEVFYSE